MSRESRSLTSWLAENAPDCGDNSCLFGGKGKGGMRTNGGCRCYKDVRPDMRRIYIERMQAALSERQEPTPIGLFWQTVGDGKWHFNEGVFCKDDIHDNGRPIRIAYLGEEAPQKRPDERPLP